jgi:NADH-quinone oxidoreductase subunit F
MAYEKLLLRNIHRDNSHTIDVYLANGGYQALRRVLKEVSPDQMLEEVKTSGLRGRGGAGFPAGMKWSFLPKTRDKPRYLCVNADESEPGTFKDRLLIEKDPHLVLEGIILSAYAIDCHTAFFYIRGEFHKGYRIFQKAIDEAYAKGLLGKNILGSGYDLDVLTYRGAGAYICGEETALLESLEGKQGKPRFKPPFPANFGLYGAPTTINNTQSVASLPTILRKGAQWFADLGVKGSGGTAIFSMSGHVEKPGNYELPLGIPFPELLAIAGGVRGGRKLKAVIPGGSSCPVVPAEKMMTLTMDFDTIKAAGSGLGTCATIVMDETTCMVKTLRRLARFYHAESCGQCTPCREGTGWLHRVLNRIIDGKGAKADIDMLVDVANKIEGHTICALGDAAAWPVQSFIKHFRHEFEYMVEHKGRSVVDDLPSVAA